MPVRRSKNSSSCRHSMKKEFSSQSNSQVQVAFCGCFFSVSTCCCNFCTSLQRATTAPSRSGLSSVVKAMTITLNSLLWNRLVLGIERIVEVLGCCLQRVHVQINLYRVVISDGDVNIHTAAVINLKARAGVVG